MARHGRSFPVRGVTVLGPRFVPPPPAPPVAAFVRPDRATPPARRPLPPRGVQVLGPKFVPAPPPAPVALFRLVRPPLSRVRPVFPRPRVYGPPAPLGPCRLLITGTPREPLTIVAMVPDAQDTTNGRQPWVIVGVFCREDV